MKAEAVSASVEQQRRSIRILKTRILWEGISEVDANWIDGDAPVDLMRGEPISGPAGVGGNWVVPSHGETPARRRPSRRDSLPSLIQKSTDKHSRKV